MLPDLAVKGLQVAGPAFFLSFQGSAVKTAMQIAVDKSVGPLSAFPFVSLLTNCYIWSLYGFNAKDMTVLVPNAIGVLSGAFCIANYHKYAKEKPTQMYTIATALIFFASTLAFSKQFQLLGTLGCVVAVILTGSPLVTLKTVIKDKSTAALPLFTSAAGWLNSCSWSLYGFLVAKDPLIYVPNLMGLFLASIQMSLYVIFGLPPATSAPKSVPNKIEL